MSELLLKLNNLWNRAMEREEGQGLVEYALILALIAVVSIAILQSLGLNVKRVFTSVDSSLSAVVP